MDYVALVTALGPTLAAVATAYKYRSDAQQAKKQLEQAAQKDDLDTLKFTFDALRVTVDELQQQKEAQQKKIENLEACIVTLTAENQKLEHARTVLTSRVEELAAENKELHEHINKLRTELSEYKRDGWQLP